MGWWRARARAFRSEAETEFRRGAGNLDQGPTHKGKNPFRFAAVTALGGEGSDPCREAGTSLEQGLIFGSGNLTLHLSGLCVTVPQNLGQ